MKSFELKMRLITLLAVMCCSLGIGSQVAQAQSPTGPFAYVTNQFSNSVSVIDTSTNTVVTTIALCGDCSLKPAGLAVTPDGSRVYVANQGNGTVSVITTSTNTVSATIAIPCDCLSTPTGVAITPDGTRAYVTDTSQAAIEVINTNPLSSTYNTVTTTITSDVGTPNGPIAITPDGSAAFYSFGTVSVGRIDTSTNSHTTTLTVGSHPTGIAVTPNNLFIYVTNNGGNTVSVIPNTPLFSPITSVTVGSGPYSVAITPNGASAYVVNQGSNSVSVINTLTQAVVATVAPSCIFTNQIAITPDGTQAYVADNECSRADVISTASNMVTAHPTVGSGPFGVAIGPTGAATTFTTPQQPIAPGTTTTFTYGTIITQTLQLPADVNMGGAAFMAVKFMQISPTVFDATRIPATGATTPNTWSGGTAVPAGTTLTPIEGAGGNGIVAEKLCFDANHTPIMPCQIFASTTLIQLTSVYNTQSPQPNPANIIATDGQNDWANITEVFNLDCCSGSSASKGLNTDEAIVNLPPTKDASSLIRVIGDFLNAGCIDNEGVANALTSKLSAAQDALGRGDIQTAINILTAFKKQLQAQSGKHIVAACTIILVQFNPVTVLLSDVQSVIDNLRTSIIPDPITGFVVDSSGVGISGATVSITPRGATATTDITGFYFFPTTGVFVPATSYTAIVTSLSGFTTSNPASQVFSWSGTAGMALSNFVLK